MIPLTKTIKRKIELYNGTHVITVTPDGVKVTRKGCRNGHVVTWFDITALGLWTGKHP